MSVRVRIPSPMRRFTNGAGMMQAEGTNVGEALVSLQAKAGGIETHLFKAAATLNRNVNIYLNDDDIRFLQNLQTPIKDGDEISIVPASAGG